MIYKDPSVFFQADSAANDSFSLQKQLVARFARDRWEADVKQGKDIIVLHLEIVYPNHNESQIFWYNFDYPDF